MAGETFLGKPWRQPYSAQQLQDAAENQVPIIGDNENWWRWDIETSQWVDTGKYAPGGKSPYIGENGYWYEWDDEKKEYVNTGKIASIADVIIPGKNLLINWDFRNPVNRQGVKTYTNPTNSGYYMMDRWAEYGSTTSFALEENGLRMQRASGATCGVMQRLNKKLLASGLTYTLSCLVKTGGETGVYLSYGLGDGKIAGSASVTEEDADADGFFVSLFTFVLPDTASGIYDFQLRCSTEATENDITVKALQLEPGDHQTLAHKDEAGNWVLNDPPNYDLQYLLTSLYSPTTGEWAGIQHSNPNLLDNWYFVGGGSQQGGGQFPVNQRGLTEYGGTALSYGIDRWVRYGDNPIMLTADGVKIRASATKTCGLVQRLEKSRLVAGETYTLSALIQMVKKDSVSKNNDNIALSYGNKADAVTGSMYMVGKVHSGDELLLHTYTFVMPESLDGFYSFRIRSVTGDVEYVVKAMQLERGPIQTLAHQDKEGNWVLNDPPPNYAMELLKCQRYQYVIKHSEIDAQTPSWPGCITSDGKWLLACVVLPVPLAKIPAVVYQNVTTTIRTISGYSNIATFNEPGTPASMGVQYFVGNQDLVLVFTFTSEIGTNNTPNITSLRSGQIILDANL